MKYLLDTNICIYLIKRRPERVLHELAKQTVGEVGISTITAAELWHGVARSQSFEDFDSAAAIVYGQVRADLEKQGKPIGPFDTLIAAHALSLDATLVTNTEREFRRVPGLIVANWAANE